MEKERYNRRNNLSILLFMVDMFDGACFKSVRHSNLITCMQFIFLYILVALIDHPIVATLTIAKFSQHTKLKLCQLKNTQYRLWGVTFVNKWISADHIINDLMLLCAGWGLDYEVVWQSFIILVAWLLFFMTATGIGLHLKK